MALGTDGFASASDIYERGRPGYPDALVGHLREAWGLTAPSLAVDVAAGTGKLARQLHAAGARCVAVEPSAAMRHECRRRAPGVRVVAGSAERLPLADHVADLVTVAQAFHWFDPVRALHEMARVLRPGGAVVLVWNERDTSLPWTGALSGIMRDAGPPPHRPAEEMRASFDGDPHFTAFARWSGRHDVPMAAAEVADMVASRSYVRVLAPADREAVLSRVRAVIAPLPEPIVVPYTTNAYCARATPARCACSGTSTGGGEGEITWSD
ncbi:MAG: class I SAM-dependent methyltransferase [Acidimicrobiales bacterium]